MSYWQKYKYPKSSNLIPASINVQINDSTLKDRIEKLLEMKEIQENPSNHTFMTSLLSQFKQKGSLSTKQVEAITRTEEKYDSTKASAAQAEFELWKQEYTEEKREKAVRLSTFYKKQNEENPSTPFYFQRTAEKILNDPSYIPTKSEYEKLVEKNKYGQRYLENSSAEPKFETGEIVRLSALGKRRGTWQLPIFVEDGTFLIIEVLPALLKNAAGAIRYSVLPTGEDKFYIVEERELLKFRK